MALEIVIKKNTKGYASFNYKIQDLIIFSKALTTSKKNMTSFCGAKH